MSYYSAIASILAERIGEPCPSFVNSSSDVENALFLSYRPELDIYRLVSVPSLVQA